MANGISTIEPREEIELKEKQMIDLVTAKERK
jgi:hypothetical protein